MKVLFIGGTGNISAACSRHAMAQGIELYHLNRGNTRADISGNVRKLNGNYKNKNHFKNLLQGLYFDVVVNFIAYNPADVESDIDIFSGITGQYIFISSASAYQKPLQHPVITESTPLCNPFWAYSRDKIACEELLLKAYREKAFPATIVRPSHTYDTIIPVAIGSFDDFTVVDRIKKGREVIIHGDGTSLWVLTHADDFAVGLTGLFGNVKTLGHAFHITSDEVLTWNQIYQGIADAVGAELKAVHITSDFISAATDRMGHTWIRGSFLGDKAASVIFDNSKIKSFVPEFKANIPYREGIKRTINWFEADPSRMVINEENNQMLDAIIGQYRGI